MVTGIKNWSTTPGDNDSPPPNGAPEGMPPSTVNDVMRQNMAEIRAWYEDPIWIDYGFALSYVDGDTIRISGDRTAIFTVGRRVRALGTGYTIYGIVTSSSYSSPNTDVNVTWDSGALDNTVASFAPSAIHTTGKPISTDSIVFKDDSVPNSALDIDALKALFAEPTGIGKDFWLTTLPSGYIWADGGTIGNAASNATNRANADTEALFTALWNDYSNTLLPIQNSAGSASTRGASAAADYAANKRLPVPDKRGRVSAGRDTMGVTGAASRLTGQSGGVAGTLGATGGAETHNLTAAQNGPHQHIVEEYAGVESFGQHINSGTGPGGSGVLTGSSGNGAAHNNVQPTIVCNYIIKL